MSIHVRSIFFVLGCLVFFGIASARLQNGLTDSVNKFSVKLFQSLLKNESGNVVCSPLSVYMALSLLSTGAHGETFKDLVNVLNIDSKEYYSRFGYMTMLNELQSIRKADFTFANTIFASIGFVPKVEFFRQSHFVFESDVQAVDFANSDRAASIINNWIGDKTRGLINDLVNARDLSSDTAMILLNAVYFKGKWEVPFNPKETYNMIFKINATYSEKVKMMQTQGFFEYGTVSNMDARFIQLPYEDNEFNLLAILPNTLAGIGKIEANLENLNIPKLLENVQKTEVHVMMPKFKVENKINLNTILKDIGLENIFSSEADFSNMSVKKLFVKSAVQKVLLEVNEEGSEGAAVTAFELSDKIAGGPPSFIINRPAILIIHSHGIPVFMTKLTNPRY